MDNNKMDEWTRVNINKMCQLTLTWYSGGMIIALVQVSYPLFCVN